MPGGGTTTPEPPLLSDAGDLPADVPADLGRLLRPLFRASAPGGGVAVAVIRGDERTVACRGHADRSGEHPVRADTRFELGSVTRTFTGLLLAEMAARGEVRYDDPIDRYLPAGAVPGYPYERPITLLHLATHTSGLPRLPVGLLPAAAPHWFTHPYATFGPTHLLRALSRTPVRGTPGTQVRYSNLGCGLLGLLLSNAAGQRYDDLLAARVCGPLGLIDTSCGPGREGTAGYRRGRWVPSFRLPALPGAAALRSTADDMLRYLQAHLSLDAVPLPERADAAALRTALGEVRRPRAGRLRGGGTRICLGWKQRPLAAGPDGEGPDGEGPDGTECETESDGLVFHTGSTRGFTAFIGFSPRAQVGLAVLAGARSLRGRWVAQSAFETLRTLAADRRPAGVAN
ncbi:serine hydrolase domain-containing protein [Streptomyces sp. NRRL WC-3742]|uniref:serine hydrolase domain-containing protein n=1 Tax=Streptomyces sp. NRRL WC-3742 TaxID=1463934 RepID=UPI00068A86A7|nr:serine hydrolase domain-containing protein [Streptomyces sp. NRRL WC-3742]